MMQVLDLIGNRLCCHSCAIPNELNYWLYSVDNQWKMCEQWLLMPPLGTPTYEVHT